MDRDRDMEGRATLGLASDIEIMNFRDEQDHPLENYRPWQEIKRRILETSGGLLLETTESPLFSMHAAVQRFNEDLVGIPIPDRPTLLGFKRGEFRLGHLHEEMEEIESALSSESLEDTVDGLIDLAYVALGTLVEMGVTAGAAFEEVHRANMEKRRGEKATRPGSLGYDAVKPDGWTPPDLEPYLALTRDQVLRLRDREVKTADPRRPKILVMGHAKHGKDTLCEVLRDRYGFRFTSSSRFCAENVVRPYFEEREDQGGPVYKTTDECFDDRVHHRGAWFNAIDEFNRPDPTALARTLLQENDVYCGMRSSREFHACNNAGLFDHVIWVDASERVGPEDRSSCTVEPWMADFVVDANGSVEEATANLDLLMGRLLP